MDDDVEEIIEESLEDSVEEIRDEFIDDSAEDSYEGQRVRSVHQGLDGEIPIEQAIDPKSSDEIYVHQNTIIRRYPVRKSQKNQSSHSIDSSGDSNFDPEDGRRSVLSKRHPVKSFNQGKMKTFSQKSTPSKKTRVRLRTLEDED